MIQVAHKDRVGNYVIGQGQNIIYATRFPAGLAAGVGCLDAGLGIAGAPHPLHPRPARIVIGDIGEIKSGEDVVGTMTLANAPDVHLLDYIFV